MFIDVGSFERACPGEPWLGYRQFCMLFLYPLLLESYRGIPFQPWLRGSLEGIHPAEARSLLRGRDTLRGGVFKHVALHAKLERSHADSTKDVRKELRDAGFAKELIEANLKGLEKLVKGLAAARRADGVERLRDDVQLLRRGHARQGGVRARRRPPAAAVARLGPGRERRAVLADRGRGLRRTRSPSTSTTAWSTGSTARSHRKTGARSFRSSGTSRIRHQGSGWRGRERLPLEQRGTPDLVLALALVHHLMISRTIPQRELVDWFAALGSELVVEFPDRDDVMVKRLLARKREGRTPTTTRIDFERALGSRFDDRSSSVELPSGTRTLYHATPRP